MNRQTHKFHKECNLKYAFDIYIKLLCLINLLNNIKELNNSRIINKFIKYKNEYLNFIEKITYFYPIMHDNINGDQLRNIIKDNLKFKNIKETKKEFIIPIRTYSGFSGHSFDCNFIAKLNDAFIHLVQLLIQIVIGEIIKD